MSPEKAFGKVLRDLRQARMISQEKLGLDSGYHRTYISLLERGAKSPTLATLFVLCRTLRISPSAMIQKVETLTQEELFTEEEG